VGKHGYDWFAIGGVIINDEDVQGYHNSLAEFLAAWPQIRTPLHLTDMRAEKKGFAWLGKLKQEERDKFWSSYRLFLGRQAVAGIACVIDRPGYVARGYGKREGQEKWLLCRSAFDIVMDRASKFARIKNRRIKVFYERADPETDKRIEGYFHNIRENGLEFDPNTSAQYQPVSTAEFNRMLIDIEGKGKQNKVMQVADSYLYAIARGSYDRKFEVYRHLADRGRMAASQVLGNEAGLVGVKTYCFELVKSRR
jgi:hypothetical protein